MPEHDPQSIITVATANTQYAHLLRDPEGLEPFKAAGTDVLLLQEVLGVSKEEVSTRLEQDNFHLVHSDLKSGLAIAVRNDAPFRVIEGSERTTSLRQASKLAKKAGEYGIKAAARLRSRDLIAIKLASLHEPTETVTVATAHPIVFARPRARSRQIYALGEAFEDPYFKVDPFLFGLDGNHYPGPGKPDRALRRRHGLQAVVLGEPTWEITGSKHQWLATIASKLLPGKSLKDFDAQLDAILFRNCSNIKALVQKIASDHKAIIASFRLR